MSDLTSSTSTTSEDYVRESDSGDTDSDTTIDFPLEKLTLSWRNITYEVQTSGLFSRTKETRTLLNQVSGHAKPGELVALMGPSGTFFQGD
jgi:ABC-type multidrug transport system fused ATPase/permease subunit